MANGHEHLEGAHHDQQHQRGEQQRGQQPGRADHVDEALAQVDGHGAQRVHRDGGGLTADAGHRQPGHAQCRAGGGRGGDQQRDPRGRRRDQQPGGGGAGDLVQHRPHHPLEAVGRQQLVLGQQRGDQRRVGRVVQPHPDAAEQADGGQQPQRQPADQRQDGDAGDRDGLQQRDHQQDVPLRAPGRRAPRRAGRRPACR
jgi:hypothetical protein